MPFFCFSSIYCAMHKRESCLTPKVMSSEFTRDWSDPNWKNKRKTDAIAILIESHSVCIVSHHKSECTARNVHGFVYSFVCSIDSKHKLLFQLNCVHYKIEIAFHPLGQFLIYFIIFHPFPIILFWFETIDSAQSPIHIYYVKYEIHWTLKQRKIRWEN